MTYRLPERSFWNLCRLKLSTLRKPRVVGMIKKLRTSELIDARSGSGQSFAELLAIPALTGAFHSKNWSATVDLRDYC